MIGWLRFGISCLGTSISSSIIISPRLSSSRSISSMSFIILRPPASRFIPRRLDVADGLNSNALSVVGTFALVVYSFPYLGLAFIPLGVFYVRSLLLILLRTLIQSMRPSTWPHRTTAKHLERSSVSIRFLGVSSTAPSASKYALPVL